MRISHMMNYHKTRRTSARFPVEQNVHEQKNKRQFCSAVNRVHTSTELDPLGDRQAQKTQKRGTCEVHRSKPASPLFQDFP